MLKKILARFRRDVGDVKKAVPEPLSEDTAPRPIKRESPPLVRPSALVSTPTIATADRLFPANAMPDGIVNGRHYTEWVDTVKTLKRNGELDQAIHLLRQCADAAEDEGRREKWGVAPWYFEQLAICFRKQKDYATEVAILERFDSLPHAPGSKPPQMRERLEKARQLLAKNTG